MKSALQPDEKRLLQFRKLTEVSRALTYAVSLEQVLHLTTERAADLLETNKAVLLLSDASGQLSVRASFGLDLAATAQLSEPLGDQLLGRLQALLEVDAKRFLGVPLVVAGQVTGILAVALAADIATSSDEQEWLLSALADQVAVVLEKSRLDEIGKFRERLIGIVSHDLRGPLSVILMSAALLSQDEMDAQSKKTLGRIKTAAERASRMIADLLDYTQAHLGGGIRVARRPADLHALARDMVEEHRVNHPTRNLEISHHGDASGSWDPDRVAQMIGNLVSNAVHYSPATSAVKVEVRGTPAEVVLVIHNEGPPIPAEQLRKVFEPMQQGALRMSMGGRSVGLGLYIVENIVAAHRGTVAVESSATAGTTFTVTLPRDAKAPP